MSTTKKTTTDSSSPLYTEVGTEMQLEFPGLENRLKLSLIGLQSNRYLIFHLPNKYYKSIDKSVYAVGTVVNIRFISRGSVFGFRSRIINLSSQPEYLIFFQYPNDLQKQVIRKNNRVYCLLPAKLSQNSINIEGTVADISLSGCSFQAKTGAFTTDQIKQIQSDKNIDFAISLPGVQGEKTMKAAVQNVVVDSEKAKFGIQFTSIDDDTRAILNNFIAMSFDLSPI